MRVKPKKGIVVRNPLNGLQVPDEGMNVPNNSYWRRRIAEGSIEIVKEIPVQKVKSETDKKPETTKPSDKK